VNIWILTIGSSDVQLKPQNNWTNLFRTGRSQLRPDRGFNPSKLPDSDRLRVPARVMGIIYSQKQAKQHFDDLAFPLIDSFLSYIEAQAITIDKVILILSDQSVFSENNRSEQKHPYWQDTCTLQPILERYLIARLQDSSNSSSSNPSGDDANDSSLNLSEDNSDDSSSNPSEDNSEAFIQSLILKAPSENEGLDHWDVVLKLTQAEFRAANFNFPQDATIYVSHQAGTPAISSAVQFTTLAEFGDRVEFLVSNEQDATLTDTIKSPAYLRGIEIQQAKKLLQRYDYSGVKELLQRQISEAERRNQRNQPRPEDGILNRVADLLDVAIQWNLAKFDIFAGRLLNFPDPYLAAQAQAYRDNPDQYWWTAYEAAYLGIVRLQQGNTVEALFHSFRAVEGLISEWARWRYPYHVRYEQDNYGKWCWFVYRTIHQELPNYRRNGFSRDNRIKLFSQSLYDLLREGMPDSVTNSDMTVFLNHARDQRNELFHQLIGLTTLDVYEAWSIPSLTVPETDEEWNILNQALQTRLLGCLGCVCGRSFEFLDQESSDGRFASLMVKVHQELERAIAQL